MQRRVGGRSCPCEEFFDQRGWEVCQQGNSLECGTGLAQIGLDRDRMTVKAGEREDPRPEGIVFKENRSFGDHVLRVLFSNGAAAQEDRENFVGLSIGVNGRNDLGKTGSGGA